MPPSGTPPAAVTPALAEERRAARASAPWLTAIRRALRDRQIDLPAPPAPTAGRDSAPDHDLWQRVLAQADDPTLAIDAGQRLGIFEVEGLFAAILSAPTPHDALQILQRYSTLAHEGLIVDVFDVQGAFGLRLRKDTGLHWADEVMFFGLFVHLARLLLNRPPAIRAVCFHFADPGIETAVESAAGAPVLFETGYTSIILDRRALHDPLPFARQRVYEAQLELVRLALARSSSELQVRVEESIEALLDAGELPSLGGVARSLYMSPRTLQRKLAAEALSLSHLVAALRLRQARRLLLSTDHPLERISTRIGFQTQASFSRFFVDHMGLTPREYRQRQGLTAPHHDNSAAGS
ncbi:MAG: helix-turn-helix domain-containing protein [Oceanococcaceae bacterium]